MVELPVLEIVNDAVEVVPVTTLPKDKPPLSPTMRVGTGSPAPEMEIVGVPLVLSEVTVTVPL